MIFNVEYAKRIRNGRNIPRDKWVTCAPSNEQVLSKWLPETSGITLKWSTCVVCGVGIAFDANKKPRNICSLCFCWSENYRKSNKDQFNLFSGV